MAKELKAGLLDEPHSIPEINNRVSKAGLNFTDSNIPKGLKRLVK